MKTVYLFDAGSGEYAGTYEAHNSPLEPGVYITPICSSATSPPPVGEHEVAVMVDGTWVIKPDWRGIALYSTVDGSPVCINVIGEVPGDQACTIPRPSAAYVWLVGQWVADAGREVAVFATEVVAYMTDEFYPLRERILNRLVGMCFIAEKAGQQAIADEILVLHQALKDIPAFPPVMAATDIDTYKTAIKLRYKFLADGASPDVRVAFKAVGP